MIVVDRRTDKEKLFELLEAGGECDELDFKETLDFSKKIDELDFVKDAVAMFNRYPGGYIIVGADDNGKPSSISGSTDWAKFDGAVLTDKIRKYVKVPLTAISQLHEVEGHTYCLICLCSPEDGLPVPFAKLGQALDGKGRQKTIFREGEFSRRDGAQNRPIEHAQWGEILRQHDAIVRRDEGGRIDALVDKIISVLGEKGKTPPLVYGMEEEALSAALASCFEQQETEKLTRFIGQCGARFQEDADAANVLTGVGSYAIAYSNDDMFEKTVDALYECYASIDQRKPDYATKHLAIVVGAYELGALLVRNKRWDLIAEFVNRQSPVSRGYIYASWLRDCQVESINAGLFNGNSSGMMISVAFDNASKHQIVAPDCGLGTVVDADAADAYLTLLCSFDFLYCLCVYVAGVGSGLAYPACCAFEGRRVAGIASQIFGNNAKIRRKLLPEDDDTSIARGLRALVAVTKDEAMKNGGKFFWGFDPARVVGAFLDEHPTQPGEQELSMFSYNNADRQNKAK